jgi:hypothetical protein
MIEGIVIFRILKIQKLPPKRLTGCVTTRSLYLRRFMTLFMFVQGRLTTAPPPEKTAQFTVQLRTTQYVIVREFTPQKYGLIVRLKPLYMVCRPLESKSKGTERSRSRNRQHKSKAGKERKSRNHQL